VSSVLPRRFASGESAHPVVAVVHEHDRGVSARPGGARGFERVVVLGEGHSGVVSADDPAAAAGFDMQHERDGTCPRQHCHPYSAAGPDPRSAARVRQAVTSSRSRRLTRPASLALIAAAVGWMLLECRIGGEHAEREAAAVGAARACCRRWQSSSPRSWRA
jgi:hypothetical protein